MEVVTPLRAFQGTDGKYNLVYDAFLTNCSTRESLVRQLTVLDADRRKDPLLTLSQKKLVDSFTSLQTAVGATTETGAKLHAGECGIAWINIAVDKQEEIPKRIIHRLQFAGTAPNGQTINYSYETAPINVETKPAVCVAPPLSGTGWLAMGGYASREGHRRALFPIDNHLFAAQTFAIDWLKLNELNSICNGDWRKNEAHLAYGQPVLAVAEATVAGAVDKFPDQQPGAPTGDYLLEFPGGNSVTLALGDGYYAFYAHLKPGSIMVKPGEKVKRGQVIAQVGNSGNSTSPHLHFHITDGPAILGANGVPYVFDSFEVEGQIVDLPKFLDKIEEGQPTTIDCFPGKDRRSNQLPTEGVILSFDSKEAR